MLPISDRRDLGRPTFQQTCKPRPVRGSVRFGISDHGMGSDCKQRAQVAVAVLGDAAEPLLASARVLLRHKADLGGQIATGLERLRVEHAGDQHRRDERPDTGNMVEPPAGSVGPVPGEDPAIGFEDLPRGHVQLHGERRKAGASKLGNSTVLRRANGLKQRLHAISADRGYNPELAMYARIALISVVRWRTNIWRIRCRTSTLCCSHVLSSTKRIVGLVTASQIASASAASFFWIFTYAFTYRGGINRTRCPSRWISRPQWCAVAHASIPTRQGGSFSKNSNTWRRRSWRRTTTLLSA